MPASELVPPFQGVGAAILRLRALECTFEALLASQGVVPAVARFGQAPGGIRDPEVERVGLGQLFPGERHRYRRSGRAPRRVGDVQRLAANVHVEVHEDLAGPLGNAPFHRDVLRVRSLEMPPDHLAHLARAIESSVRSIGTKTCRPVLPEVFTTALNPMLASNSRRWNATSFPFSKATVFSSGSSPGASLPE